MEKPPLARDIMVTKLVTVSPGTHVLEAIKLLLGRKITGAPVVDEAGRYLGMLSEKCSLGVLALSTKLAKERDELLDGGPTANDFMTRKLVTLRPDMGAVEAIDVLLRSRISGAPVVDAQGRLLGVFSEKFSMNLLITLAYDQFPSSEVRAFMNTDLGRVIAPELNVMEVAQVFLDTPYRRLPVMRGDALVGQVSRRDVLNAGHHLHDAIADPHQALLEHGSGLDVSDGRRPRYLGELPSPEVAAFMDKKARTITEEADLLEIAQIFISTPYRRLPVLRGGKLVGQVSRRDVLQVAQGLLRTIHKEKRKGLYLSAFLDPQDTPPALH